jgi:hypothetical protein
MAEIFVPHAPQSTVVSPEKGRTGDQHDAYSIAAWLSRADQDGRLAAPCTGQPCRVMNRVSGLSQQKSTKFGSAYSPKPSQMVVTRAVYVTAKSN